METGLNYTSRNHTDKQTDSNGVNSRHGSVKSHVVSTNPFDDLEEEGEECIARDCVKDLETKELLYDENYFSSINEIEQHWKDLSDLLSTSLTDPFALQEFREHLSVIGEVLNKELTHSASSNRTSECLALFLSENMLEKMYLFSTRQRIYCSDVRLALLNFFTALLTFPGPPLFIHQQVLRPLNRLLRVCEMSQDVALRNGLIPLLQQICILIQEDESLLHLFFINGAGQVPSKFLVFSQLVHYMHDPLESGTRARDAMLLCLSIAGRSPHSSLCDFIVADTDFCQVLSAGLNALYSELPTTIELIIDEWQSPLPVLEASVPQLKTFMMALSFCNSVLQMAPLLVCQACVSLIKNGFLQQVLGPALLQNSPEEITVATGYLTSFLLHITNVQLMRTFLQFIISGECDGQPVVNALVQNISSDSQQLASMSLELFHVLFDLNCEDVLLELVLKFLLPGRHVMPNQLAIIGNRDLYSVASKKLLALIPQCYTTAEHQLFESLSSSPQTSQPPSPPPELSRSSSPSLQTYQESPLHISTPTGSVIRVRRDSTSSTCSTSTVSSVGISTAQQHSHIQAPTTNTPLTINPFVDFNSLFEATPLEVTYFNYLMESREAIEKCAKGCRCWSNTYDQCIPVNENTDKQTDSIRRELDINTVIITTELTTLSIEDAIQHDNPKDMTNKMDVEKLSPSHCNLEPRSRESSPTISPNVSPRTQRRSIRKLLDPSGPRERFSDCVGLLLKVLFEKVSRLLQNPPIVNLLLIKAVTRLAQYPQPLLRSLLLNHQLVLKPGVPNLFYVLHDLKQGIDRLARERDNFEIRIGRAKKTMMYNAAVKNGVIDEITANKIALQMKDMSRADSRLSDQSDGVPAIGDKKVTEENTLTPPIRRRRAMTEGSKGLAEMRRKRKKHKVNINMVYSIILFGEFLKELSSLSQEHAVLNPELLYSSNECT